MPQEDRSNLTVINSLRLAVRRGTVVHAYIFSGDEDAAEKTAADFAGDLLCTEPAEGKACGRCLACRKYLHGNHEDFISMEPAGAHILVSDIEALQEKLKYKAFGSRRVVIIKKADSMMPAAQNKLLKTLEEPPEGTVILLAVQRRSAMLQTVLSRCVDLTVASAEADVTAAASEAAEKYLLLLSRRSEFYKLKESLVPLLEDPALTRDLALEFFSAAEDILEKALLAENGAFIPDKHIYKEVSGNMGTGGILSAAHMIGEARKAVLQNASAAYVLKSLCLGI